MNALRAFVLKAFFLGKKMKKKSFVVKNLTNRFLFFAVLFIAFMVAFLERSNVQLILTLSLFLITGWFLRRKYLFLGIAIVIIAFVFVVKENFGTHSIDSSSNFMKFQFSTDQGDTTE